MFITEVPNFLRQYIALYRHFPPIMFKYAMTVVFSDFIRICLELFQDSKYLFKAKKRVFNSKKLMRLCSFASHRPPIGKHPSVAPQPNSLSSLYIVSAYKPWKCAETNSVTLEMLKS